MLDDLLLIACICIIVASLFFLFYINRFLAWILSLLIRFLYWTQGASSFYITIGSIQFSLLAGRILLKDVHYHSSNQTIRIVKGKIQWRYWIRRPMDEDDLAASMGPEEKVAGHSRSCRLSLSLQGLEWTIYNRTAAYENIISQMEAQRATASGANSIRTSLQHKNAQRSNIATVSYFGVSKRSRTPVFLQNAFNWFRHQLPNLDPKELLPIEIEITKGNIIVGNSSTPSLLVAEFKRSTGAFGVVPARSKLDLHKNVLNLSFRNATISYKHNADYQTSMLTAGEALKGKLKRESRWSSAVSYTGFLKLWKQLKLYKFTQKQWPSNNAGHATRAPADEDFSMSEYAIERKVLEAPQLDLCYYADVVGVIPERSSRTPSSTGDLGNGDTDPDWGIDLSVKRGVLRYGPWADRQRAELQRAFFPLTYTSNKAMEPLRPGENRVWPNMKVFLELCDETKLHIPFREASKNWQWDGYLDEGPPAAKREAAWLHLTAADKSTIHYIMPMVASSKGYEPLLEVHLDTVTISSNLNDIKLVEAESCRIRCELPSPLVWSEKRTWTIGITLRHSLLYLLRDHINLFTDLGKDWASGPPSDFNKFVPMIYCVSFDLDHYALKLNANDHNIVDKPLKKEENVLFTLQGTHLGTSVEIPSDKFRPEASKVSFRVNIPDVSLRLSLPRWNTNALHQPKNGISIAKIKSFVIDGSYLYYADTQKDNVEQLKLKLLGEDVAFKLLGWSVRYIMVLRENYFGAFTHFSTLSEYLDRRRKGIPPGDPVLQKYRPDKSNMMHVDLSVRVVSGLIIMPCGLFGYERTSVDEHMNSSKDTGPCLCIGIPQLQVICRVHDHFMDLSVNIDPAMARIESAFPEEIDCSYRKRARDTLFIDGIDITANRLFGPMPKTMTYLCVWEIGIGNIRARLSAEEAALVAAAGKAFKTNFTDVINSPAKAFTPPEFPDLTFLQLEVTSVDATWETEGAALVVSLDRGIQLNSNDLGGDTYKKTLNVRIPVAIAKVLVPSSTGDVWLEAADIEADAHIDMYMSPVGWKSLAVEQAKFVTSQDAQSQRVAKMLSYLGANKGSKHDHSSSHANGVYLPQPTLSSLAGLKPHAPRCVSQSRHVNEAKPNRQPTFSDSDGEFGVSDADRDARLAKMRISAAPIAQIPNAYLDGNLSSGDESDNDDLEKDYYSDSTISDDRSTPSNGQPWASQCRYKHFTRTHLRSPASMWPGNQFHLHKDTNFRLPHVVSSASVADHPKPMMSLRDEGLTVIKLTSRRAIRLHLTPIFINALVSFEGDIGKMNTSHELFLDSLLMDAIDKTSEKTDEDSSTLLHVRLTAVQVGLVYDIAEHGKETDVDKYVMIQPCIQDIWLQAGLGADGPYVGAGFQLLRIPVASFASGHQRTTLCATASAFGMAYDTKNLSASWDLLNLDVDQTGPMLIPPLLNAFMATVEELRPIAQKWKRITKQPILQIMEDLLHPDLAEDDNIDPFAAIQPSYLVQMGRPFDLRGSLTMRLLFHLRNQMWRLRMAGKTFSPQDTGMVDFQSALEVRLSTLDPDAYIEYDMQLLCKLLPQLKLPKPPGATTNVKPVSTRQCSVFAKSTTLCILDPDGNGPSMIELSGITLRSLTQTSDLQASHLAALSHTSLPGGGETGLQSVSIIASIEGLNVSAHPHLMGFAQQVLRARKALPVQKPIASSPSKKAFWLTWVFKLDSMRLRAVAETITVEIGLSGFNSTSSVLRMQDTSSNHTVIFRDVWISALSSADLARHVDTVLAKMLLHDCRLNSVIKQPKDQVIEVRCLLDMDGAYLHVPRSAIRLYQFIEGWSADFLPGYEAALRELLTEAKTDNNRPSPPQEVAKKRVQAIVQADFKLRCLGIYLQVMHGIWLTLEIQDISCYSLNSPAVKRNASHSFGLKTAASVFCIVSTENINDAASSDVKGKVSFPAVTISGGYNGFRIRAMVLIEVLKFKVKPSHWDTLLSVQQKFGQDFNDFIVIASKNRHRDKPASPRPRQHKVKTNLVIFVKMKGFRVELEGPSSALYLDCKNINGRFNDAQVDRTWSVTLSDLALSLASGSVRIPSKPMSFSQSRHSAFVIIDCQINGCDAATPDSLASGNFEVLLTRVHAVMQPSSISEVGDFIDHLQAEMLVRKDQRARDMAAFKERTQSIMKTFDVSTKDVSLQDQTDWLTKYNIDIAISNVGIAFPLTHTNDLELPQVGSSDQSAVRAFLFSIKTIRFGTQRGETGSASLEMLSFQFVSRFRQSASEDFSGDNHDSRNKLVYPEMRAQLRSSGTSVARQITMQASVSGFIVDLDSTIPDFVFSLIDVYRKGKQRLAQLAASAPKSHSTSDGASADQERHNKSPTSNIFVSLQFLSGKVRMYGGQASHMAKLKKREVSDAELLDMGAEIFNLPEVSVWAEYRAAASSRNDDLASSTGPSILMFKSTVHSSQNTLRPSLLPFLTELVTRVDRRLRTASQVLAPAQPLTPAIESNPIEPTSTSDTSMQISFSLRIDQSKLELTCQPDVNVIAGVHWDSGGFVVNISPGARNVTFTGSVGGLTVGLRHGFLSDDCVKLDARNLAFSVTFSKLSIEPNKTISSLSVVLDTEFLGVVRFSRLQDILCFKAVWLDRIPVFNGQNTQLTKTSSKSDLHLAAPQPHALSQELKTLVLVRIRHIGLEVDLGQSISNVTLDLRDSIIRTKFDEVASELSVFVADVVIHGKGNLAGKAEVSRCVFQTTKLMQADVGRMLELRMTSGALAAILDSDHQRILHYRAEPLEVEIFDDWATASRKNMSDKRPIQMVFSVNSPEIAALATISTIPKLILYVNKFKVNLEHQKQGAIRESAMFRATQAPKPEKPLSAFAEAMLQSARSKIKEAESGLSYIIRQQMNLRLGLLQLLVFPRNMAESEVAQFIGRNVQARLERVVESRSAPMKRDIRLSFSSMIISRFSQLGRGLSLRPEIENGREWLQTLLKDASEANIVGLPSMMMHMESEELLENKQRLLIYNFYSRFLRDPHETSQDDIYITLNVNLYAWLTLLRKTLMREMDQAKMAADAKSVQNYTSGALRRRLPEPLVIPEAPVLEKEHSASALVDDRTKPPGGISFPKPDPSSNALSCNIPLSPTIPNPDNQPVLLGPRNASKLDPSASSSSRLELIYTPRERQIERLTMRQLGEATPDVMHPFFMKKAGFNLEDSLPQYVNEFAVGPLEQIMEALLKLYSKQLLAGSANS